MDGGMLSQDEINALLNGMDLTVDGNSGSDSDMGGDTESAVLDVPDPLDNVNPEDIITDVEKDAVGEIANISMGSSATTLYSLVNRKVNISTPTVELASWKNLLLEYENPCVFIQNKYTVGLDGTNILVLKERDVKVITDLMMGGDGTNIDGELSELHLSAISEAMNQMMGASATSLSTMLKKTIDISPPEASLLDLTQFKSGEEISPFLGGIFIKASFRMQIDDLVDSVIIQLYPIDFAKLLVDTFLHNKVESTGADSKPADVSAAQQPAAEAQVNMGTPGMGMNPMDMGGMQMGMPQMGMGMNPQMGMPQMGMGMNPQMGMPQMGMGMPQMSMGMNPQMGMPQMGMGMPQMGMNQQMQNVNVQPAQFQSFSQDGLGIQGQENIGLIMDVPLEVTVELGRSTKSISEILDFAPGTIIELDRIAGEPIDVLVNGKFVAKGEVVVIEESFGVRVTEIIK